MRFGRRASWAAAARRLELALRRGVAPRRGRPRPDGGAGGAGGRRAAETGSAGPGEAALTSRGSADLTVPVIAPDLTDATPVTDRLLARFADGAAEQAEVRAAGNSMGQVEGGGPEVPADQVQTGAAAASGSRSTRRTHRSADEPIVRTGAPTDPSAIRALADQVEALLVGDDAALWQVSPPHTRRQLILAFGLHYGLPRLAERTGLSPAEPPEDVHAMSRGSLARGGSYYEADYVVESLGAAGAAPGGGTRWLDFGCSSGRVVRALAAAWPTAVWYGCDPNVDAIAWARSALPRIDFTVSPQDPPLSYPDGYFDAAFAISIWSHFAPGAALRWLAEMHRVLRPGGHLLITTHGVSSITYYARTQQRPLWQLQEVGTALARSGHWYAPEFGESGDHGIVNPEWGTAFLTPDWLTSKTSDAWTLAGFHPARNAGNQDVMVLVRGE